MLQRMLFIPPPHQFIPLTHQKFLARYLTNQWTEFHQTLVDDVVQAEDELIRFEGQEVKVKLQRGQIFECVIAAGGCIMIHIDAWASSII